MKIKAFFFFSSLLSLNLSAQKATEAKAAYKLDSNEIQSLNVFLEGVRLKSLGKTIEALNLFDYETSMNPKNDAAYFEAAGLELELQNINSAIIKSKKAYELKKSNKHYSEFYLNLLTKTGKIEDAIEVMEDILKSGKGDDITKMQYAYLLSINGNSKKALSILEEFESKGEFNEAIAYEKIKIYINQKDYARAETEFKKMIQANPGDSRFLGNLAEFYLKISKLEEADKVFNDILRTEPNNVSALLYKVQYFQMKKDDLNYKKTVLMLISNKELNLDTKISLLSERFANGSKIDSNDRLFLITIGEKLIAQYPSESRAYQVMGDMHYLDQNFEKARLNYLKSLSIQNTEFNVWQNLFYTLTSLKNFQELADSTNSALDLFPANGSVYFYNGIANSQLERHELAEKSYRRGIKFVGENRALESQLYSSLGETYHKLKKYDESDKYFEMAIKIDADNAYTLNNFAYYLSLRKDKLDYAKTMSKKSLEIDKENPSFLDTYAWICFQLEKFEDAKYYQEKALIFGKEDMTTIYEHYGDILIKLNDIDNALKYWNKAKETGSKSKSLPLKISTKQYQVNQE